MLWNKHYPRHDKDKKRAKIKKRVIVQWVLTDLFLHVTHMKTIGETTCGLNNVWEKRLVGETTALQVINKRIISARFLRKITGRLPLFSRNVVHAGFILDTLEQRVTIVTKKQLTIVFYIKYGNQDQCTSPIKGSWES